MGEVNQGVKACVMQSIRFLSILSVFIVLGSPLPSLSSDLNGRYGFVPCSDVHGQAALSLSPLLVVVYVSEKVVRRAKSGELLRVVYKSICKEK